ncbi:MAG: substrate-binding domain-containing protein [Tannerella sp.]|jgi:phosphate transport system substrate-binding protein|nr:substrate-binding domain-containing protein [Tannerella sp.]
MKKTSIFLWFIVGLFGACSGGQRQGRGGDGVSVAPDGLRGEIQLSGAFALYPMAVRWAEEFKRIHPHVRFDVSGGGAGKGMTDVLAGVVDIGMVSREIYPEEREKGALGFAAVKDAVVLTVNAGHPDLPALKRTGMTKNVAKRLWNGEFKTWGEALGIDSRFPVHVFTRSDACGAAATFAAWFDARQEQLKATAVFGDPGIADAVRKDKAGVGYNNIAYAYDQQTKKTFAGLEVLPIDVNENGVVDPEEAFYQSTESLIAAITDGRYPSPPARDLYFVTNGKPVKPEVVAFLEYVLSEGQQFAGESGYISLSKEQLEEERRKLN